MKKVILMLMLFAPLATFAQKFGHVDTQSIIQSLPDFSRANGEIEAIGKQYENDLKASQDEFQRQAEDYEKKKSSMNATQQQETEQKLQEMYAKIQQQAQQSQQEFLQIVIKPFNSFCHGTFYLSLYSMPHPGIRYISVSG